MSEPFKRDREGSKNIINNNAPSMHKKQLYAMTLHELLGKPVWQMTGEELLFLAQHGKTHDEGEVTRKLPPKNKNTLSMGLLDSLASSVAVCPPPIASSKAEKSIEPSHKLVEKSSLMQNLLSNSQGAK